MLAVVSWCCAYVNPFQDNRPVLPVSVHGMKVASLFDSGANVTACSDRFFNKLKDRPIVKPSRLSLNTASGERLRVMGIANLRYQLGQQTFTHPTYVIKGLKQKSIVGADAMAKQNLVIDVRGKRIVKDIQLPTEKMNTQKKGPIALAKKVEIQPFTEKVVIGKASGKPGEKVIISPLHSSALLVESLVTFAEPDKIPVVLKNSTNSPILLERNEVLGYCERWDDTWNSISIEELVTKRTPSTTSARITEQDVDMTGIPTCYQGKYLKLLNEFVDVFSVDPYDIGKCDVIKQKLILKDANKIASRPPYRIPHHLKEVAEKYIDDLLRADVIQKSSSPFSAPIMVIPKAKQDHKKALCENYRIVADYRMLNSNLVNDCYPLHNIYDLIDEVATGAVWSVIDLSSGFWNQVLDTDSRRYTAFGIPGKGHFEFTRAPQGIKTSPASFQRLLDFVIRGLKGCFCYVDDVVISSKTHEEHLQTLSEVFKRFRKYNLKCRLRKVQLGTPEINYLGYNLTRKNGIRAGEVKINAVKNWKPPEDVKQVKQFLGLASFFRRTIQNFAIIASPLNKLTRKDSPWKSGTLPENALEAFRKLKTALCKRPCLQPVNFDKEVILTVDASTSVGLGAVLSQKNDQGVEHPCAYASRSLKDEEKKYAPFVLEAVGMLWAFRHFRPYLAGKHFTVRTDHQPLLSLNKTQSVMMDRIRLEIMDFQPFTVEYLNGDKMPADGLSRNIAPSCSELSTVNIGKTINWEQVFHLQKNDGYIKALACFLRWRQMPFKDSYKKFVNEIKDIAVLERGVVCVNKFGRRLVLAPFALRDAIMRSHHDSPIAGHFGPDKTLQSVTEFWYWPEMSQTIKTYCQQCHTCATVNVPHSMKKAPLQEMPIPRHFNDRVAADLCGPFRPTLDGFTYVLVMVDMFSKFVRFCPLKDKRGDTVAKAIFDNWICQFSSMNTLQTDMGTDFTNNVTSHLYQKLDIQHQTTSPGHPQSNGQAERYVRKLLTYIRKYIGESSAWDDLLPSAQLSFNTSLHSSTNQTPHFLAFKERPNLPYGIAVPSQSRKTHFDSDTKNVIAEWHNINHDVRSELRNAFAAAKTAFDKNAMERKYDIGSIVYITRPKTGSQVQKFQPPFTGPYVVLARSNKDNYKLKLQNGRKEITVHANRIKPLPFRQQLYKYSQPTEETFEEKEHVNRPLTRSRARQQSAINDFSPFLSNQLGPDAESAVASSESESRPASSSPRSPQESASDQDWSEKSTRSTSMEEGDQTIIGEEGDQTLVEEPDTGSWHLSESEEEARKSSESLPATQQPHETASTRQASSEPTLSTEEQVSENVQIPTSSLGARPKTPKKIVKELPFPEPLKTRSKTTEKLPEAHQVPLPLARKPPSKSKTPTGEAQSLPSLAGKKTKAEETTSQSAAALSKTRVSMTTEKEKELRTRKKTASQLAKSTRQQEEKK
jgi:transposase InsO family protein